MISFNNLSLNLTYKSMNYEEDHLGAVIAVGSVLVQLFQKRGTKWIPIGIMVEYICQLNFV